VSKGKERRGGGGYVCRGPYGCSSALLKGEYIRDEILWFGKREEWEIFEKGAVWRRLCVGVEASLNFGSFEWKQASRRS